MTSKKRIKTSQYVLWCILFLFTVLCLLPVLLTLIASFTDEAALTMNGFSFFPEKWSLESWKYLGKMGDQLIQSYKVTIAMTVVGILSTLLIDSMMAYALSRSQFKLRGILSIMLLITMLFSGGQLASYVINTSVYHLKNTFLILCLPMIGAMDIIIMRTYIQGSIHDALIESAKIDGAKEFRIYWQIVLPLMKPTLASIGFMKAVAYWNEWQRGYMYITESNKYPLQLLLMRIENQIKLLKSDMVTAEAAAVLAKNIPSVGVRMAMLFTTLGPIMVIYPFFQKYFVKGLTVGSVKG